MSLQRLPWPGLRRASDRPPAAAPSADGAAATPSRRVRALLPAIGLVFALACLGALILSLSLRRQLLAEAERETAGSAIILASYTKNSIRSAEQVQDAMLARVAALGIETEAAFRARFARATVDEDLRSRIAAVPHLHMAYFADATGLVIATSRGPAPEPWNIAAEGRFAMARDHPMGGSVISAPFHSQALGGAWTVDLLRRVSAPDGRFLGVVGVGLQMDGMVALLSNINPGAQDVVEIWRRDGHLLARNPPAPGLLGVAVPEIVQVFEAGLAGTDYASGQRRLVDGVERLYAIRALPNHPVVVSIGRVMDDVLAPWRRKMRYLILALLGLGAALGSFLLFSLRQIRAQDELTSARAELRVQDEQRRAEARIAHLAHHDALTGLANRTLFGHCLNEALAAVGKGDRFALLCLDLDGFKNVNDMFGHPVGDWLLREVTGRLRGELPASDTIARLGGDEFAIIQPAISGPEDAASLAQRIVESLARPFHWEGQRLTIGVSIGIACSPDDGASSEQLLQNADMALYRAKAAGRGRFCRFEPEMVAHAQMRRLLQTDLRRGIAAGEFELHYQPQVDLRDGRVTGFEALLRWHHPEKGMIMPERFIAMAEELGLIIPLGEWVIHRACAEAATWPPGTRVAVNLSPVQFRDPCLPSMVEAALQEAGIEPARLELEITEMAILHDSEATLDTLHGIRALGVAVALDDFGTGYSSLSRLLRFPFDRLKIDRSFIRNLGQAREADAIVRAVIDLCAALDIATTAEGVETEAQRASLATAGCHEGQGYLFGKPQPIAAMGAMLKV